MAKKKKNEEEKSICGNCEKIDDFSFQDCASACQTFIAHIKAVFARGRSPCFEFRCRVPGIGPKSRELCEICPLPKMFSDGLGYGPECAIGKNRDNIPKIAWRFENWRQGKKRYGRSRR
ncbi:MAG: hypothetical protein ABH830_00540 [Patescibacteria group bacterium]